MGLRPTKEVMKMRETVGQAPPPADRRPRRSTGRGPAGRPHLQRRGFPQTVKHPASGQSHCGRPGSVVSFRSAGDRH